MNPNGATWVIPPGWEAGLIDSFDLAAPRGFTFALGRIVRQAYPKAREFCEGIAAPEEDRDLRGHVRRAIIEGALLALPARFPGLIVRPATNVTQSQYHREIVIGDWVMTFSHTDYVQAALPDARFRDTLAAPQAGFFPELAPWTGNPAGQLFAVVVHGSASPYALAPSFLNIVFPIPGGAHGRGIDLYSRHANLRPKPQQRPSFGQPEPELRDDLDLGEEGTGEGGA